MTINAGEAVRFLPIVQNGWHFQAQGGFPEGASPILLQGGGACYNSSYWFPFCLPIRAKYNDYGSIEDIASKTEQDKAELAQFIGAFKKHAIPLTVGENEYHDVPLQEFTMEEILEALREGRVYTKYNLPAQGSITLTVSWMMIKESVWQSLLAMDMFKTDDGRFYEKYHSEITLEGLREKINRYIKATVDLDALEDKADELKKNGTAEEYAAIYAAMRELRTGGFDSLNRLATWSHGEWKFSPEFIPELANTITEMEFVNGLLGLLRINYAPTGGAGSQTPNQATWQMAFDAWTKIAHKDEHQYDDE
jgi:hypothetical protein